MFGVKLRPASQQRSSSSSISSVSSTGERTSSNNVDNIKVHIETPDVNGFVKSHSVDNVQAGIKTPRRPPPVPLPRSISLTAKSSNVVPAKHTPSTEMQNQSHEGVSAKRIDNAIPQRSNNEAGSRMGVSQVKRQTSVDKSEKPIISRKPPTFKPPPPPPRENINASTQTPEKVKVKSDSNNGGLEPTVVNTQYSNNTADETLNENGDINSLAENKDTHIIEKNEENNNTINTDLDNGEATEDARCASPVQMRRSTRIDEGSSPPVPMRRSRKTPVSTQAKAESVSKNSQSCETFEDVDISHVVMRRSTTTSTRSVSDLSHLKLETFESDEEGDDDAFDETPFHNIFITTKEKHTELPGKLCIDAYKKLKTYLEKNDKYFVLETYAPSSSDPVNELRRLLSS